MFIICGAPASGKSTYAAKLAREHKAILLDIDTVSERLVRTGLAASGRSPDDRDSEYFKITWREAIYETLFAVARENLSFRSVAVVGPFTRELSDPSWPDRLSATLGDPVEIHYVCCSPEVRRERMKQRANPRDLAKLANWEHYLKYYGQVERPPFRHVFVDTSAG